MANRGYDVVVDVDQEVSNRSGTINPLREHATNTSAYRAT
jgi:hypothetical protein